MATRQSRRRRRRGNDAGRAWLGLEAARGDRRPGELAPTGLTVGQSGRLITARAAPSSRFHEARAAASGHNIAVQRPQHRRSAYVLLFAPLRSKSGVRCSLYPPRRRAGALCSRRAHPFLTLPRPRRRPLVPTRAVVFQSLRKLFAGERPVAKALRKKVYPVQKRETGHLGESSPEKLLGFDHFALLSTAAGHGFQGLGWRGQLRMPQQPMSVRARERQKEKPRPRCAQLVIDRPPRYGLAATI